MPQFAKILTIVEFTLEKSRNKLPSLEVLRNF